MTIQPELTPAVQASRTAARRSAEADRVAAFGVSAEEAAANVTAAVPLLAAVGLPAAEACTDPRHTGPVRAQLGCTGPDPAETVEQPTDMAEGPEDAARRFARRLRAVELLCSGRPGYHTVTVKALLTAMGEADEEQPLAVVGSYARAGLAKGLAPASLTTAELEQGQADADQLAAEHPDTIAALVDEIADDIPHRRAPQIAADYLARHARLLAVEARKRLTERDAEMRADGYRGRVAWCSGMREVVKLLDSIAADHHAPKAAAPAVEQPLAFPQLAVPCPQCDALARQLCTSHSGTRQRTSDTHQARTRAYRDQQAGR